MVIQKIAPYDNPKDPSSPKLRMVNWNLNAIYIYICVSELI